MLGTTGRVHENPYPTHVIREPMARAVRKSTTASVAQLDAAGLPAGVIAKNNRLHQGVVRRGVDGTSQEVEETVCPEDAYGLTSITVGDEGVSPVASALYQAMFGSPSER